jgi:hypothetical protein
MPRECQILPDLTITCNAPLTRLFFIVSSWLIGQEHKARMALHATFFRTNFVKGAHLDKVYSMVYQTSLVKHVLEQKINDDRFQKSTKILLIDNHITSDFNMKKSIS